MNKLVFNSKELEVLKRVFFNQRGFYEICKSGISDIYFAIIVLRYVKQYNSDISFKCVVSCDFSEHNICCYIIRKLSDFLAYNL